MSQMPNPLARLLVAASLLSLAALALPASAQPPQQPPQATAKPLAYTGTNLSSAEFGDVKPGNTGLFNKAYTYPNQGEFDYFTGVGMNVFRVPFRWERLQPTPKGPLDSAELDRLKAVVRMGTAKGGIVVLDPHNYARYYGDVIGGPKVGADVFADFWAKLAAAFEDNPRVWFGLVNEPYDIPAAQWLGDANAAIAAIRGADAKNLILVPGIAWTGAHSWISSGNGATMLGVIDPANHYVFEVHQYLDSDSSGSHKEVVSPAIGVERLRAFTDWCRTHHKKAFLGEFGVASDPTSLTAVATTLDYLQANADVWTGFTWWASGPWWGDYMYTLEPKDGHERPQLTALRPYLQKK